MAKLKYIQNIKQFNTENNFILSALNLAFIGYLYANKIKPNDNFIIWPDGIFAIRHGCKKKIPGRDLIKKLKISKSIKKIIVMGNCSKKELLYLKLKFNLNIENFKLPFGEYTKIVKSLPKIRRNCLYILTLPTPLQEQIASLISKKNKKFKVICLGGGLKMAAGLEKSCPKFIYNIGLEFLWRLRDDFKRRIIRLIYTFFMYNLFLLSKQKIILQRIA